MNIEKCEDCNKDISTNALACPHCGGVSRKSKKINTFMWYTLVFLLSLFMAITVYIFFFFKPFGVPVSSTPTSIQPKAGKT